MSIAGVVGILLLLVTVVAPLGAGVLLIVFSRRRGPDHPACGKCGYNIDASIGAVTRCPECGVDFAQAGITPPRAGGTRNRFMVTTGVVLIVLAVGCFGSSLVLQQARVAQSQAARATAAQRAAAAAQNAAAVTDAEQPTAEDGPDAGP